MTRKANSKEKVNRELSLSNFTTDDGRLIAGRKCRLFHFNKFAWTRLTFSVLKSHHIVGRAAFGLVKPRYPAMFETRQVLALFWGWRKLIRIRDKPESRIYCTMWLPVVFGSRLLVVVQAKFAKQSLLAFLLAWYDKGSREAKLFPGISCLKPRC